MKDTESETHAQPDRRCRLPKSAGAEARGWEGDQRELNHFFKLRRLARVTMREQV